MAASSLQEVATALLHGETADVFQAMRPIRQGELVRGQYAGYLKEKGVAQDSEAETPARKSIRGVCLAAGLPRCVGASESSCFFPRGVWPG